MRLSHIFGLSILFVISLYGVSEQNITSSDVNSTSTFDLLVSKEDGAFDVSDYLATKYGFMPVPMIITEPAIGYGGGLTLLFLHDTLGSALKKKSPPSITGIMAAGTENGTWFGAAFHIGHWLEDSIRSTTAAGVMNVNMNFYPVDSFALDLNINGYLAYQELMFRLGESNFFLGGNYMYIDNTIKANSDNILSDIFNKFEPEIKMGGLAGIFQYDSRDTTFTPSEGLFAKATVRRFDENLGGEQNFWRYGAKAFYFIPAGNSIVLGLRAEGEAVSAKGDDNVPLYSYPSISMRGIPAMRYQGEKMALAEMQLRWEFINRWNLVAFGGAGKTFGTNNVGLLDTKFSDAPTHPAGGVGFRYELARKFGLWGGLDFATSQDRDLAFYITVGSAWGAF